MKKGKILFGIIIFLFVISGFCNISNVVAIDDPDYSVTIGAGQIYKISGNLHEVEVVRVEYDIISGGQKDLYIYVENSLGVKVKDLGLVYGYGLFYFNVPYDDYFSFAFSNAHALITSKYVEIKIDIVKTLTITFPISTSTFLSGYNYITWTSTGDIDYIQIYLYRNGGYLETIDSYEFNDGSYTWYIYDDEYTDSSYYQIVIVDYYDNTVYDYSDYFTIECEIEKTITITSPISIDTFILGYNYITWSTTGDIDYVRIDLYEGSYLLETLTTYTDNDGYYDWYLSSYDTYEGNYYRIKISDYDDDSIYIFSDYFAIEIEYPSTLDDSGGNLFWWVLISISIVVASVVAIGLIYRHRKRILNEIISIEKETPVKNQSIKLQEKKLIEITHCTSCGAEILDEISQFCPECGTPIK